MPGSCSVQLNAGCEIPSAKQLRNGGLYKRTIAYVINAGNFGRIELFVVAAARCEVEPSAAYSADEETVVDGELDDGVEGLLPGFKEHLQLKINMDLKQIKRC